MSTEYNTPPYVHVFDDVEYQVGQQARITITTPDQLRVVGHKVGTIVKINPATRRISLTSSEFKSYPRPRSFAIDSGNVEPI